MTTVNLWSYSNVRNINSLHFWSSLKSKKYNVYSLHHFRSSYKDVFSHLYSVIFTIIIITIALWLHKKIMKVPTFYIKATVRKFLLTAICDIIITITTSWNCPFRGHSIIMPSLDKNRSCLFRTWQEWNPRLSFQLQTNWRLFLNLLTESKDNLVTGCPLKIWTRESRNCFLDAWKVFQSFVSLLSVALWW